MIEAPIYTVFIVINLWEILFLLKVTNMDLFNGRLDLSEELSTLIEQTRHAIYANANKATVFLFWDIGRRISNDILQNKRAGYGKQIVSAIATQFSKRYGPSFETRNLRRMMQFAE